MHRKQIVLATLFSIALHIAVPFAETIAVRHGRSVEGFDAVVSWPAWLCSVIVPRGHGIPQLVFPLFFSVALCSILLDCACRS